MYILIWPVAAACEHGSGLTNLPVRGRAPIRIHVDVYMYGYTHIYIHIYIYVYVLIYIRT